MVETIVRAQPWTDVCGLLLGDNRGVAAVVTRDPRVAAAALRRGNLAVLPTETVYGLGARALDERAVQRVFDTKERPSTHPLILHLAGMDQLDGYAADVTSYARDLAAACWPGPLTIVTRRRPDLPGFVTRGLPTIALRVPRHDATLAVLAELQQPVAAPSANRFGHVSPTRIEHVREEIGDRLAPADVILDGGSARVGLESTIVDCTSSVPIVLRPGSVTREEIASVTGLSPLRPEDVASPSTRAPGTLARHYQPEARVTVVRATDVAGKGGSLLVRPGSGLIAPLHVPTPAGVLRLADPGSVEEYARVLYQALREADTRGLRHVAVVEPEGSGLAEAIRDRLSRAAGIR
jgi:L-threonylcarbamoyladenylate synthase